MSDTLVNLRDIRFVLYEMLGVETLTEYEYFRDHSRETFDTVMDAAYKLAREVCWPAYAEMDRIGVTYDAKSQEDPGSGSACTRIWQAFKEGGWHGEIAPFEYRRPTISERCGGGDVVDVQRRQHRREHVYRRRLRRRGL